MKISRKRWVILWQGKQVLCGLNRNFYFKPFDAIAGAAIKTYMSRDKAVAAALKICGAIDGSGYTVAEVTETIDFGAGEAVD